MTCPVDVAVAAYVLGTLDPADRAEVEAHLPSCAACRSREEELAGLPALLALVPADVAARGLPEPHPQLLDRLLATVSASAAAEVARRRRRRLLVIAAAAVLVLGGAGVVALVQDDGASVVTAAAGPVQARVQLEPVSSGTDLSLQLSGVAPGQECRLVAVTADGRRDVAATWLVAYTGEVTIRGRTALDVDAIDRLVVETLDERALVELEVAG